MRRVEDHEAIHVAVEPVPATPPPGAALAPADRVPLFRTDLLVTRGASPGLYEVAVPGAPHGFTVYEFELAICRLLDGRRTVAEVVEQGVRLGIPVDLAGLHQFVRQMGHYGFLAPSGTEAAPGASTWAERDAWDEGTRTLFQTGVRLMRAGRPADAAAYFEAVLDVHPGSAEASEMLAIVGKGSALVAPPPPGALVAAAPRAGRARRALAAGGVVAAVALAAAAALVLRARPPAPAPAPAPLAVTPPVPVPVPAPEPAPRWRLAPVASRGPASLATLAAPAAGTLRWRAAAGAPVREGELVAEVRVEGSRGAVRPELARRIAELEALAAQDPVYEDFLAKARREARGARRAARVLRVVAPATGVLERPEPPPVRVEEGAALGEIVDAGRLRLAATLDGPAPAPDAACEVLGSGEDERAPCRVVAARAADGGGTVLTVEAEASPFVAAGEALRLRVAPDAPASP